MPPDVVLDDLEKAAGNLGRLHAYLAARVAWTAESEAWTALDELDRTLKQVADSLSPYLAAAQVGPGESAAPGVEPKPQGTLDPVRLMRFAGFLEQLSVWLDSRDANRVPDGGSTALGSIAAAVDGAQRAVADMSRDGPAPEQISPSMPPPIPPPPPGSAQEQPAGDPESRVEEVEAPPDGGVPLVLDPTGDVPLFQTRAGFSELSPEAQSLLDTFVADNGLDMNPSGRRAFGLTVKQRLEGAPEGHGLLLRVGGLRGRLEPYFTYTLLGEPRDPDED